jgi:hypothetical protein
MQAKSEDLFIAVKLVIFNPNESIPIHLYGLFSLDFHPIDAFIKCFYSSANINKRQRRQDFVFFYPTLGRDMVISFRY